MRTSKTHPLKIAEISPAAGMGRIGLTFCPGKKQAHAASGAWDRDLMRDVEVITQWNAAAVVTMVEEHELVALKVPHLGKAVLDAHMAWHHLPIRDGGVPGPAFEKQWTQSGRELRALVRDGFNVLIHCKGGLGRAGTIAARLLVELGMAPDRAIAAVRAVRPGAIETSGQLSHVLGAAAVPEERPDTSRVAVADRAVGAMLGLAVGDALGTTLEFAPRDSKPRLADIVGGGPFRLRPGEWTDDTAMALALMDSLLVHPNLDEADLMDRFVGWHENGQYSCTDTCFDIGVSTRAALARYKRTGDPLAGSLDPGTAGNGSLMRLAPVAIRYWNDRTRLRDVAARQSRTTHGAREAVDACVAFADMLADAIAGAPRSQLLQPREESCAPAIAGILAGCWRGAHRSVIRSTGYVVHALEASLWSTGRTGSFGDAVLTATNLGEDADTTGAITGQLAGALYGASAIAPRWKEKLAWCQSITDMAKALFDASLA